MLIDEKNNPWFKAKTCAIILGYVNTRQAILLHVDEKKNKKNIKILMS